MTEQIFSSIPIDQLESLFREAIRAEISQLLDQQKFEPLIKTEEACEILGVSKVTLLQWRKQGLIPCHKLNTRVYFKKSELLAATQNLPNRKGRRKVA
ncbi:MAG: helix-turn-helix domain-containing protein [Bacteroidota bacterium]